MKNTTRIRRENEANDDMYWADWLILILILILIYRLIDLADWVWLIECLIDRSTDWLIDWLIDWLTFIAMHILNLIHERQMILWQMVSFEFEFRVRFWAIHTYNIGKYIDWFSITIHSEHTRLTGLSFIAIPQLLLLGERERERDAFGRVFQIEFSS